MTSSARLAVIVSLLSSTLAPGCARNCPPPVEAPGAQATGSALPENAQPVSTISASNYPNCDEAIDSVTRLHGSELDDQARSELHSRCTEHWGKASKQCLVDARTPGEAKECRTAEGRRIRIPSNSDRRALQQFERFVNGICTCSDMQCVEDQQRAWAKIGAELAKDMRPEEAAEMAKKMEPLTKKMSECVDRIAAGNP